MHRLIGVTCTCLGWLALTMGCGGSDHPAGDAGPSSTDASSPDDLDGAMDGGPAEAITAPDDEWTWVDFPSSKCGAGTPTGIGINLHAGATETLIFFQGGGGCANGPACWGSPPKAIYMSGFGLDQFSSNHVQNKVLRYPILRRDEDTNPFKDMNMVFVPYCTGDLHAGTAVANLTYDSETIPTYFWGAKDLGIFLTRLVPTFPDAQHIWLAGVSAGGFGSFLSFDAVANAFPDARVDILDDSGPPIPRKDGLGSPGFTVWHYQPPAGCDDCSSIPEIYDYVREVSPNSRYGLLTYAVDTTISVDFGYTPEEYPAAIAAFEDHIADDPSAHTFVVENTYTEGTEAHVVQSDPELAPFYLPWVTQMVSDDDAWANESVTPP